MVEDEESVAYIVSNDNATINVHFQMVFGLVSIFLGLIIGLKKRTLLWLQCSTLFYIE